ncbi:MAG: hypothetical protein WC975_08205 [Phycisphaerae bacterium]
MKNSLFLPIFVVFIATNYGLSQTSQPAEEAKKKPIVFHFQIYDPIEDSKQAEALINRLHSVGRDTDRVVAISIDTPGGDPVLVEKMLDAVNAFQGKKIAFIDYGRYGGCFGYPVALALACDTVIMHPKASLGTKEKIEPLALANCKGFRPSEIHPLMMDYWRQGVPLITKDPEIVECVERLSVVTQKRTSSGGQTVEMFSQKRTVRSSGGLTIQHVCFDAQKALECKMVDRLADKIDPEVEDVVGTKNYVDADILLKSNLDKTIRNMLAKGQMLNSNTRHVEGAKAELAACIRKQSSAKTVAQIFRIQPHLQVILARQLQNDFKVYPSTASGYIPRDWFLDDFQKVIDSYEEQIQTLRVDAAREEQERKRRDNIGGGYIQNANERIGPNDSGGYRTGRRSRNRR